jgi:uncharacterized protein YndB with AHSA1/START domain
MMSALAPTADQMTFTLSQEIHIHASPQHAFEALLEEMGPSNLTHDGAPLPMKLEAWPGGRWFRDLGADNGHLWGLVQSIKRPVLLEIWGPLFMSTGATSNLMYRLTEEDGGTLISFTHTVVGPFPEDHRPRMGTGWTALHARVRAAAERT